jgi:hypothetical protein
VGGEGEEVGEAGASDEGVLVLRHDEGGPVPVEDEGAHGGGLLLGGEGGGREGWRSRVRNETDSYDTRKRTWLKSGEEGHSRSLW